MPQPSSQSVAKRRSLIPGPSQRRISASSILSWTLAILGLKGGPQARGQWADGGLSSKLIRSIRPLVTATR
jgi:hypothetical protein